MTAPRPSLPEYAHPPLVAATLGVGISKMNFVEINPSLLREFQEKFGPEWIGEWTLIEGEKLDYRTDVGFTNHGYQLKNMLGDRIVQISNHSLGFTWWGTDNSRYPRYENLRDGFVAAWDVWSSVQPELAQNQMFWRVRYLNRIPQGTVWQSPGDWTFFRLLAGIPELTKQVSSARLDLKIPDLEYALDVNWTFDDGQEKDALPSIWIRLTAFGDFCNQASTVLDGMDAGRAAIVQTFSDLMSPAANAYWGLKRREK